MYMAYIKTETPNAVYYINLGTPSRPVDSVPKNARIDAVCPAYSYQSTAPSAEFETGPNEEYMKLVETRDYGKRRASVYFFDPGTNRQTTGEETTRKAEMIARTNRIPEIARIFTLPGGAALAGKIIYDIAKKNGKISRRRFLAYGAAGAALAIPHIVLDFLKSVGPVSQKEGSASKYRELGLQFREYLTKNYTPWTHLYRNTIMAERMERLAKPLNKSLGRKPVIAVYVETENGIGLENLLHKPRVREGLIRDAVRIFGGPRLTGVFVPKVMKWNPEKKAFGEPQPIPDDLSKSKANTARRKADTKQVSRREAFRKVKIMFRG